MARPCKPDTRHFRRTLTTEQRAVILAAGRGDLSKGFEELLSIYIRLHSLGYRPSMGTDSISLVINENDSQLR